MRARSCSAKQGISVKLVLSQRIGQWRRLVRHRQPMQIQSLRVNSELRSSFLKMIVFHMARWKVGDQIIIAQSGARPVLVPASAPRGPSICHYDLEIGLVASSSPAHVSPVAGIFHSNYSGSLDPRNHLVILGWAAVVDQPTGAWRFQPQLELARFAELFRPLAGCLEKRVQIVASQGNGGNESTGGWSVHQRPAAAIHAAPAP